MVLFLKRMSRAERLDLHYLLSFLNHGTGLKQVEWLSYWLIIYNLTDHQRFNVVIVFAGCLANRKIIAVLVTADRVIYLLSFRPIAIEHDRGHAVLTLTRTECYQEDISNIALLSEHI